MTFFERLRTVFFYSFSFLFVVFVSIFFVFYYFGRDLPSERTLLSYSPPTTTKIFSSDGELIEEYAIEHRVVVPFSEIPSVVKSAFLVAEDREFFSHSGICVSSILRAMFENTAKRTWDKRPAGGSTITQQIAKNLLVGNSRSLARKIREAIMAFRIEASIKKDKILEIYLNQLYLGKGCYGVVEACNRYFDKSIQDIEVHEAALLASLTNAPSILIDMSDASKLLTKRNAIIQQMYELGYISMDQLKFSIAQPVEMKRRKSKFAAPYFSDEIFRIFAQQISKDQFFKGGFTIVTTMNKKIQKCAEKALEDGLIEFTKSEKWRGILGNASDNPGISLAEISKHLPATINKIVPCIVMRISKDILTCELRDKRVVKMKVDETANLKEKDVVLCRLTDDGKTYELYQTPKITGGIVVMDLANGDILGMSGGFSFDISTFNCVTQAMRQPGSTIKPFVYAAAFENGKDEYDIIEDKAVSIKLSDGTRYTPQNYNGKVYGSTYLRDGIIYSRNLTTVNLALEIGMNPISKLLYRAELIKRNIPISSVLGSVETTPLKLLTAFSAFFNGGEMMYPRFIKGIQKSGEVVNTKLSHIRFKKIIEPETAQKMKEILHDVVKYGTAQRCLPLEEKYGVGICGKTGTTNDFKDAWFVGCIENKSCSKLYLVCVFVGYPIPKSMGEHSSGSRVALPVFERFVALIRSSWPQ
ncbi:MAG: transglycosylase domain-containing protein [Holosporales bacterium]|jgi:penicillin-binding protein 1A|nr:transglycosylase domain-containing protein [Holosporales bacterium]